MKAERFSRLRMTFLAAGLLVWLPWLYCKFVRGAPFPTAWVLSVHVPCMSLALTLRAAEWWDRRRSGKAEGGG